MRAKVLPASPNWYSSQVSDVNQDTFVFGARQNVYVYKFDGTELEHVWTFVGHRERVTSVTLCHTESALSQCCSGDEDGKVKLWDIHSRAILQEHANHLVKVCAISWSPVDEYLVVSGDDKGVIVTWRLQEKHAGVFTPESGQSVVSLACSTQDRNVIAVGYKNGLILLLSLAKKGEIIHRLRGLDDEVHSLAWCSSPGEAIHSQKKGDSPHSVPSEVDERASTDGCLLASGCKNRTVTVWSSLTGKPIETFKLPTNTGPRRERWDEQGRSRIWVTVCWPKHSSTKLVSSSHNGELLLWDLCKPGKNRWEQFKTGASAIPGHSRIVFNISCGGEEHDTLISTSMDRQIVVWDLPSLAPKFNLATLGGFVYAVESSAHDPGQVAIGVGDNLIRIWNVSDQKNQYNVTSLWQGIKSKVTSLSWHPSKEGVLAYGTDDGRVGIYQTLSNKPPHLSSTYHKKTVYVVNWGPACPPSDSDGAQSLCVYSVGDGLIKEHLPHKLDKEAVDIHSIISATNGKKDKYPIRSDIRWRQDFSVVAVGNDDGSVELFRPPDFKLVCVIRLHQKLINCIRWHPPFTSPSPTMSPCQHWLATGSNENTVYVVDLSPVLESLSTGKSEVVTVTSSTAQLEGHSGRITGLSWNPHVDGQLVSASYDGTAQVWDVLNKEQVANFRGHGGKLLCAEWSPLEADVIMTGGDDFMLQVWRVSEQEHKTCPSGKRRTKGRGKNKKRMVSEIEKSSDSTTADVEGGNMELPKEIEDLLEAKRRQLLMETEDTKLDGALSSETSVKQTKSSSLTVADILGKDDIEEEEKDDEESSEKGDKSKGQFVSRSDYSRKKRRPKSMFPVLCGRENCSRQQQHEDLLNLVNKIYVSTCPDEESDNEDTHLALYLNRREVYRCLKREGQHHIDHDNMDYYLQLEIWKGNIRGALKFAREKDDLSDWLVAMAPMDSHQLWVEACVDYAQQLEDEGQYHKAASYYLAAHKVYDAINLFRRHRMFREAVALAKLRLSPLDPAHEELYATWGQQLTKEGHFEQAAKCYVAIKQVREAAKILAKRSDQQSLRTAAHMNFIANENHEGLIYAQKVVHHHLLTKNWAKIHEFCEESKQLKVFILLACLHELMLKELPGVDPSLKDLANQAVFTSHGQETVAAGKLPEFIVNMNESDPMSPWKPHLVGNQTFAHRVLRLWCTKYEVEMEMCSLEDLYKTLKTIHQSPASLDTLQLLVQVSYELSRALLSLLLGDTTASIRHFNVAISSLHNSSNHRLMQAVCRLFFPLGPNYVLKLQHEVTALRVLMNIDNSNPYNSSMKSHTTKKYWSEPKEDELISNGGLRCRELDCLRAYYYLEVIYYLRDQQAHPVTTNTDQAAGPLPEDVRETGGLQSESASCNGQVVMSKSSTEVTQASSLAMGGLQDTKPVNKVSGDGDSKSINSIAEDSGNTNNPVNGSEKVKTVTPFDLSEDLKPLDGLTKGTVTAEKCQSALTEESPKKVAGDQHTEVQESTTCSASSQEDVCPTTSSAEACDSPSEQSEACEVTLVKLKYLAKSLLWDIQGKRFALTETLGYVHRAMSQLLLRQADRSQSKELQSKGENSDKSLNSSREESGVDVLHEKMSQKDETVVPDECLISNAKFKDFHGASDERQRPSLPPDIVVGLPNETFNIAGLDNYVCISDLWKHPSLSLDHLQSSSLQSPFQDYVKPKKVLWKDNPEEDPLSSDMSRRKSLDFSCPHDNGSLPSEWNHLPVDKRYTRPYITQEILQQEEEFIKGELLRGPDSDQMMFPNPLHSAALLLDVCDSGLQPLEEKSQFFEKVADWALFFSVTSLDRELFRTKKQKFLTVSQLNPC